MGLGEGIVRKFVHEGARVLIFDINEKAGQAVGASLPKGAAVFFVGSVTSEADWANAFEAVIKAFGKLDVVVNNAGVVHVAAVSLFGHDHDAGKL